MFGRRLLRIKALKALYTHIQQGGDNLIKSQQRLNTSLDRAYDLYILLLNLPVAMADLSRAQMKTASEKHLATYQDKNPNKKFVESKLINLIEFSDSINDYCAINKLSWKRDPDLVKTLWGRFSESVSFKEYMASGDSSLKEDVALIESFYVDVVQSCEAFEPSMESLSIFMCGDLPHILPLVVRTLSNIRPSHTQVKLVNMYKNDSDKEFVTRLFERSLVNLNKYQTYIEQFTANWDAERIVFMDNLILVVAMAELYTFPDIPAKVTMDEYIEISKYYSTPNSSTFINGILDRITNTLNIDGEIDKRE